MLGGRVQGVGQLMLHQGRVCACKSKRAQCLLQVPGTLHFVAKAPGHSFDHAAMNLSHSVGYFYFGNKPSPRRRKVRRLHVTCAGLQLDCL